MRGFSVFTSYSLSGPGLEPGAPRGAAGGRLAVFGRGERLLPRRRHRHSRALGRARRADLVDLHQDVLSPFFCGEGLPDWAVQQGLAMVQRTRYTKFTAHRGS